MAHWVLRDMDQPSEPFSNSRIIPTAPATASAHSVRVTADIKLRGANRPKLPNSKVSQKTRRATTAFGVPCPSCCVNSQRVSDRKSTRLNSSHLGISYAVFCLKKK